MDSSVPLVLLLLMCSSIMVEAQLKVYDLRATDLPTVVLLTTDAYVTVSSGSTSLGKTSVRYNDPNPWWEEEFSYFYTEENDTLTLEVYDVDLVFDDQLGVCQRQLKVGTYQHDCFLTKGGTLHYTYTLG
ncbi:protein C2-DOMAIN ABA-RELATED 4-like [Astatotilapia calliptera]|uniref:C2 domain-containing protein n=1 Tax=Astatotilapia calliptera TaxID=8154 RepID=A0AAX7UVE0_ASTCA|nr:protein C2-DOMAIN ABA-RELATED 4-like [Astatotilapia calliptera]XP_026012472.1 protein C2-DOMAIN ABA-RELATED 4-like [Astatotilapia calliptera]